MSEKYKYRYNVDWKQVVAITYTAYYLLVFAILKSKSFIFFKFSHFETISHRSFILISI